MIFINIETKELKVDKEKVSIKKLIDISNDEKYKKEVYYQKFVKRYNIDEMIKTDNFMRKHKYNNETFSLAIENLRKEIFLDKKELANIESDFEKLSKIKVTSENKKDIKQAYDNLTRLKEKFKLNYPKIMLILLSIKLFKRT